MQCLFLFSFALFVFLDNFFYRPFIFRSNLIQRWFMWQRRENLIARIPLSPRINCTIVSSAVYPCSIRSKMKQAQTKYTQKLKCTKISFYLLVVCVLCFGADYFFQLNRYLRQILFMQVSNSLFSFRCFSHACKSDAWCDCHNSSFFFFKNCIHELFQYFLMRTDFVQFSLCVYCFRCVIVAFRLVHNMVVIIAHSLALPFYDQFAHWWVCLQSHMWIERITAVECACLNVWCGWWSFLPHSLHNSSVQLQCKTIHSCYVAYDDDQLKHFTWHHHLWAKNKIWEYKYTNRNETDLN